MPLSPARGCFVFAINANTQSAIIDLKDIKWLSNANVNCLQKILAS